MSKVDSTPLGIATIDHIDQTAILIGFTDGTSISLTVEELLILRPDRLKLDEPSDSM